MARGLNAATKAAIATRAVRPRFFLELEFAGGTVRVWSGTGQVAFQGELYSGAGQLGRVAPITESGELRANAVSFGLSGIDPAAVALSLGEDYQGRPARLWYALVDQAGAVIGDPVQLFSGLMDTMPAEISGESAGIEVTAESHLARLRRADGRLYTAGDQQERYPDDKGFDYVAAIADKEFIWGGGKDESNKFAATAAIGAAQRLSGT